MFIRVGIVKPWTICVAFGPSHRLAHVQVCRNLLAKGRTIENSGGSKPAESLLYLNQQLPVRTGWIFQQFMDTLMVTFDSRRQPADAETLCAPPPEIRVVDEIKL